MPITKFIGILLVCYAVYYFFVIAIDLVHSKKTAVASDRRSLHSVEYELPETPHVRSQKVSKETHSGVASKDGRPSLEAKIENHPEETEEHQEENSEEESALSDRNPADSFDLSEEQKLFSLEHEEMSEGIEVSEENFGKLVSIV